MTSWTRSWDQVNAARFLSDMRLSLTLRSTGRAAGFHDDERDVAIDKPALELVAREAMLLNDVPGRISHGQLEYGFGQVDGHGSSIFIVDFFC